MKIKKMFYCAIALCLFTLSSCGPENVDYANKVLLVIGSEGNGVGRLVKKNCDQILAIPMSGYVNSLNASVSCGIST